MSIDLKLLIFISVIVLVGIIWLMWRLSRSRPAFDDNYLAVWDTAPLGVMLLSNVNRLQYANKRVNELFRAADLDIAATAAFKQLLEQLQPSAGVQQFGLNITPETRLGVWSGVFGSTRLILLRDLSEQGQREQAMQLFWGGISHEMRTPLTSILAHLEVARSEPVSEEVRQHSLDIVYGQAQRLNKLIQNALELGRLKAAVGMEITAVDIILIAEEAIADLILLAESQGINISLANTMVN